jgi:hypothetical protein
MHSASILGIAMPFLVIAAVNAGDPGPRPEKPPAEKAKRAARDPEVTARRLDQVFYLYLPLSTPAERKIEDALRSPCPPIEFVETELKDVVGYLKDATKVEIQLDATAMKDAGIDVGKEVTENIRGVSLASALDLLLGKMGLTWEVRHEVLWITTPKFAAEHRMTRLYPVDDLVPAGGKDGKSPDDYATLIDLITAAVAPGSWGNKDGAGSIKGATLGGPKVLWLSAPDKVQLEAAPDLGPAKLLSVSATYRVHHELAEYLANIRRIHRVGGAQGLRDGR